MNMMATDAENADTLQSLYLTEKEKKEVLPRRQSRLIERIPRLTGALAERIPSRPLPLRKGHRSGMRCPHGGLEQSMKERYSLSRRVWVLLAFLDLCAIGTISFGILELFGSEWYNGPLLIATGAGLLWLNTPSKHSRISPLTTSP